MNENINGSWSTKCKSNNRTDRYSKYFTFSLDTATIVKINLRSDTDTYLYLLDGDGINGSILYENDDITTGITNSGITENLSAGTYTIEATTYSSERTDYFSLSLIIDDNQMPSDNCIASVSINQTINNSWINECESVHRSGRYTGYYTFSIASETNIQIDLISESDTYLFLLNDEVNGEFIDKNDDVAKGDYNSRINVNLPAGTYVIEATTYGNEVTGDYTLYVQDTDNIQLVNCTESVSMNTTLTGHWLSACESNNRSGSYSKYYSFTIPSTTYVNINLESDTEDTYLFLLSDEGDVIDRNDDADKTTRNSYIGRSLAGDTYIIEATTFNNGMTGLFTLSVNDDPKVDNSPLPSENGTNWTTDIYSNNTDMNATLSITDADYLSVTVTGETERGHDYINIYDSNGNEIERLSGDINETFTVAGSSIDTQLISDGDIAGNGVSVSIQEINDIGSNIDSETSSNVNYNLGVDIVKTYLTMGDHQKAVTYISRLQDAFKIYDFLNGLLLEHTDPTERVLYSLEFFLKNSSNVLFGDLLPEGSVVATYRALKDNYDTYAEIDLSCHNLYVKVEEPGVFFGWNDVRDATVSLSQITYYDHELSALSGGLFASFK